MRDNLTVAARWFGVAAFLFCIFVLAVFAILFWTYLITRPGGGTY